jgi:DNA (cytosine-5)-methyltransferase 1
MTTTSSQPEYRAAEFFAGIGLVGEALGSEGVEVVYANDIDPVKERLFVANYDRSVFHRGDIRAITGQQIPDVDVATASFPCTDVSLAGNRAGLEGEQSGMFWEFARILQEMGERRPRVILLENVVGFYSSNGGEDLRAAFERLNGLGYFCDLVYADARWFVPQSRPRLFIVGSLSALDSSVAGSTICSQVRPPWFAAFVARHPDLKLQLIELTPPVSKVQGLDDVVERIPADDGRWWDQQRTEAFLHSLSNVNSARLDRLKTSSTLTWRTAYRRTRYGRPVWEIRDDQISGCLRTARGGSSKQAVVEAGGGQVRIRWMTAREYARLQGVPNFKFGGVSESQAMFGFGDAVCVPVVRWIISNYVLPLLDGSALQYAEPLVRAAAL